MSYCHAEKLYAKKINDGLDTLYNSEVLLQFFFVFFNYSYFALPSSLPSLPPFCLEDGKSSIFL